MPLPITAFTVSLEVANGDYGTGQKNFVSFRAEAKGPEEGVTIDEALEQSLDMHLRAWESVLQARHAEQVLSGKDFSDMTSKARVRIEKTRQFLKQLDDRSTEDGPSNT
jgi:hypothetical protein